MSSHAAYHALGQDEALQDPTNLSPRAQLAAPQFRSPISSIPSGYQQGASPYGQQEQPHYQQVSKNGHQIQEQGYFPPHSQSERQNDGTSGGLATQMGSMGLGNETLSSARSNKKKNRHAYHNLDQPTGSSQAFNAIPQGEVNSSQYLDQRHTASGHPYAGQQITPAMTQFPSPAGVSFTPGNQSTLGSRTPPVPVPSGPGVSAQGKVDPEQIPSIPRARDGPAQYYLDHIYHTMDQHLPPPGAIPFVAYDQGNSSPKYARLTLNNIPSSSEALAATALPLGLILQPLAPIQPGEQVIPVLDFGEQGPPRCRRCRTYINPFMMFRSGGNKLVCNMCTFPNDVSTDYFAPTDPSGVRVDRDQRAELKLGTVEFMVPKEYWAKEPVGLRWLFLIDVGQEAINRGFLEAFCEGLLGALYGENSKTESDGNPDGDGIELISSIPVGSKVGFVTFDKEVHFYNCNVFAMSTLLTPAILTAI